MGFFRKHRVIISAFLAALFCYFYLLLMGEWANNFGYDGMGIILFALISMPFIVVPIYRLILKSLKPADAPEEGNVGLEKKVGFHWLIIIVLVVTFYLYLAVKGVV